jgi:hypothetical protein
MNLHHLKERADQSEDLKLKNLLDQLRSLIQELNQRRLPNDITDFINHDIDEINASPLTGSGLRKLVKQKQNRILKQLEKQLKLVTKRYYQTLWMVLGMSAFGVPIGIVMGSIIKNMGMIGVGLPIGMGIGIAVGSVLDKKAAEEGRQLNFESKF